MTIRINEQPSSELEIVFSKLFVAAMESLNDVNTVSDLQKIVYVLYIVLNDLC